MKKICILADFPIDSLGGEVSGRGGGQQSTWLPQLAQAFQYFRDFDIHWVVFCRKVKMMKIVEKFNQTFHIVPVGPYSLDLALNYYPARIKLARVIKKIMPDLIHAWGTETRYSAAMLGWKGIKILSMQGIITEYMRRDCLPDNWRWRKMVNFESKFMRSATIITSESEWGMSRVQEIVPGAQCRMIEYGVHPSFYDIEWSPDPSVPYALFIGGGGRRKGLDVLLGALQSMTDRKWELRIAGGLSDVEKADLAKLDKVKYLGMLSWQEMREQLKFAWCSVLPTRADTSPNSVKEARVVGVPVVTTCHGGQAGYVVDGVNGRVIYDLNARALSEALSDVMSSHSRVEILGKGNHLKDREYLRSENTANSFISLYGELLG